MLTTQKSLIFRIRDLNDADAWSRFVEIYGPLVYRYGRRRGLQDADATDLSQAVLTEVSRCIDRFNYDESLGRFRNWLMVIARYKLNRLFQKVKREAGSGDTKILRMLEQQPADDELDAMWENEYRNHLFRWASEQVREAITEPTWQAFWRTAVENKTPAEVAIELNIRVSAVYVARSRVMARIRDVIASVDDTVERES